MLLTIFSALFIILAIVLAVQLVSLLYGITKKMKPMHASNYVSSVAIVMLAYIINAFILVFLIPDIYSKILMISFGLMPFIIGDVSSYHKLRFYSIIQILCIISSGLYIIGL